MAWFAHLENFPATQRQAKTNYPVSVCATELCAWLHWFVYVYVIDKLHLSAVMDN